MGLIVYPISKTQTKLKQKKAKSPESVRRKSCLQELKHGSSGNVHLWANGSDMALPTRQKVSFKRTGMMTETTTWMKVKICYTEEACSTRTNTVRFCYGV